MVVVAVAIQSVPKGHPHPRPCPRLPTSGSSTCRDSPGLRRRKLPRKTARGLQRLKYRSGVPEEEEEYTHRFSCAS